MSESEANESTNERERVDAGVAALAALRLDDVAVGLVLGSGLARFARELTATTVVPFADVPHWPAPAVAGHGGSLVVGSLSGVRVACLTGRVHLYEGYAPNVVVRAVRTLRRAGVPRFVLTNAAGGIARGLRAGDLMRIGDHLNLTGTSPLLGPHEPAFGPRFPDQSRTWSSDLARRLHRVDAELKVGVYAGLLGPSYETPAEIRSLRRSGADAVGMSTVVEAIALAAMGAELAGVSLISNLAAGIADKPLDHSEVVAAGAAAAQRFGRLLVGFCRGFA